MHGATTFSSASSTPFASTTVDACATRGILACTPDADLAEVAGLLANNNTHCIIVADDSGPEPPVIADLDLIAAAETGRFSSLTAGDVAAEYAVSIAADASLAEAASAFMRHRVTHLLVRDEARDPIGILSTLDLIRALAEKG